MPQYRRKREPGASYFFTVVTQNRRPIFNDPSARSLLRRAFEKTDNQMPFELWAIVLLPDHLHCIWNLPEGDSDFSARWSAIKRTFSQRWIELVGNTTTQFKSHRKHRELGVWQRRFWEHQIRNETEMYIYRDYIHFNPVKHGYVAEPSDWEWSSVHRHVRLGWLSPNWTGNPAISVDPRADV
ncbi:MAG TPA: transposase [Phycisphaerae bacterium]|nr:transposase [Phycisphaerae bacterium]